MVPLLFGTYTPAIIIIGFCFVVFKGIDQLTIDSWRSYVRDISIIPQEYRARLEHCGVTLAKDLWHMKDDPRRREHIRACIAATPAELTVWIKAAEMVMLKGMGTRNFQMLSCAGITDVESLAQQDAHALRKTLETLRCSDNQKKPFPDEAKIRVWITAARRISPSSR